MQRSQKKSRELREESRVVELIEVRNADINARDDNGRTALFNARNRNKADIVSYLVSHGESSE
jgi:hypothetical protein